MIFILAAHVITLALVQVGASSAEFQSQILKTTLISPLQFKTSVLNRLVCSSPDSNKHSQLSTSDPGWLQELCAQNEHLKKATSQQGFFTGFSEGDVELIFERLKGESDAKRLAEFIMKKKCAKVPEICSSESDKASIQSELQKCFEAAKKQKSNWQEFVKQSLFSTPALQTIKCDLDEPQKLPLYCYQKLILK